MQKLFILFVLLICSTANAENITKSNQFVLVVTADGKTHQGTLQRYERQTTTAPWSTVGKVIPVVIGQKGMALGLDFNHGLVKGPIKKEGDNRTPMGIFNLGPAFGFDKTSPFTDQFDYFPINKTTVCVDDQKSHYYNQVIDSSSIFKPDWHSQEQMRNIPIYKYGSIIQYNSEQRIPGAGSCIFMHIWASHDKGTAGCVGLDEANLKEILSWLKTTQKPTIGLFTRQAYQVLKKEWQLP